MFERFTRQARDVVVRAQREARELHHDRIGTEHLLLAVLRAPEEAGAATLARMGLTHEGCRNAVDALVVRDGDVLDAGDAEALRTLGIDLDEIRRRTEQSFGPGALDAPARREGGRRRWPFPGRRGERAERSPDAGGHIPFTPRAKKALELSLREAVAVKDRHIGVEHVVLGLLRSDDELTRALFRALRLDIREARELVHSDLRPAA